MARRRRFHGNGYQRRNPGLERALAHIEDARKLTLELGGTDKDVKEYFFNLSPAQLKPVLEAYERAHGTSKREYAELTIPQWRSGRRAMSGTVAERLFALLPGLMPVEKKYDLVKSLWESKCPTSHKTVYVGLDVPIEEIGSFVRNHLETVVTEYRVPDTIVRRFTWLANDDVEMQQKLLNYFLQLNREVVSRAASDRVPRLLEQIKNAQTVRSQISQQLCVGKHTLELVLRSDASGISETAPHKPGGCLSAVLFVAAAWWLLTHV